MGSNKIWLRAETKPAEARSALTPTTCKALIDAGYEVTIERSTQRIFDDEEFAKVGAPLVEEGSWVKDAPKDAYILGLKELPEDDFPLEHVHISFAHCYKEQGGWEKVLSRWPRGGGVLLDLEFLTDDVGRRVAAFGWSAGYAGAALAVKNWAWQLTHPEGEPLTGETPYANQDLLIQSVKESLEAGKKRSGKSPRILVIGALGRCGNGAVQLAKDVGIPESDIIQWDMAETKKGGPFKEIVEDADIFVNCIYLSSKIPHCKFIKPSNDKKKLTGIVVNVESLSTPNRRLTNPNNPIPVYDITTTFDKPTVPVTLPEGNQATPLSVISIDHLPSLLPRESSEMFSQALMPSLLQLKDRENARVWKQAEDLFNEKEKPTTVAAYAAGASLAAVALFYVFGPNYTIDGEELGRSGKKSIVGLSNPANDCFINSVLQALAGLGDLRLYLIRELHRRELDGPEIYNTLPEPDELLREKRPDRVRELQQGTITRALKEMLDRLNERPIYKKTITARGFIQALEFAYRTRISRNQQDAQEFLQIVTERLSDEYHAGVRARQRAEISLEPTPEQGDDAKSEIEVRIDDGTENGLPAIIDTKLKEIDNEYGFPFEGKMESQIECQFCQYKYKPNQTSFVNLTLQVPQKSSTTLNACFDGLLKTEYIEDFRCDKCRLLHAAEVKSIEVARARSEEDRQTLQTELEKIQIALTSDPECALEGVALPPPEQAPKRRIARHMRITVFPKIIAIHLSRSIFDHSSSSKNAAKVAFPERLPLGGILSQKWFKLLAIVCHKGSHNSGHYESFRRNHLYPPFSTPSVFSSYAQSRATSENPSRVQSPRIPPRSSGSGTVDTDPPALNISTPGSTSSQSPSSLSPSEPSRPLSTTDLRPGTAPAPTQPANTTSASNPSRPTTSTSSSRVSFQSTHSSTKQTLSPISATARGSSLDTARLSSPASRASLAERNLSATGSASATDTEAAPGSGTASSMKAKLRRKKKPVDRWWRISDEKIKECKTGDVLGMQKEVYLLFYEMEKVVP
ncbi:hypothetical protein BDV19DRAFT_378781 [Aspergillus venezuelensis]